MANNTKNVSITASDTIFLGSHNGLMSLSNQMIEKRTDVENGLYTYIDSPESATIIVTSNGVLVACNDGGRLCAGVVFTPESLTREPGAFFANTLFNRQLMGSGSISIVEGGNSPVRYDDLEKLGYINKNKMPVADNISYDKALNISKYAIITDEVPTVNLKVKGKRVYMGDRLNKTQRKGRLYTFIIEEVVGFHDIRKYYQDEPVPEVGVRDREVPISLECKTKLAPTMNMGYIQFLVGPSGSSKSRASKIVKNDFSVWHDKHLGRKAVTSGTKKGPRAAEIDRLLTVIVYDTEPIEIMDSIVDHEIHIFTDILPAEATAMLAMHFAEHPDYQHVYMQRDSVTYGVDTELNVHSRLQGGGLDSKTLLGMIRLSKFSHPDVTMLVTFRLQDDKLDQWWREFVGSSSFMWLTLGDLVINDNRNRFADGDTGPFFSLKYDNTSRNFKLTPNFNINKNRSGKA